MRPSRKPPPFAAALHQFVLCGARRPTCPTVRRSSRQEVVYHRRVAQQQSHLPQYENMATHPRQCAAVVETLHANLHRRRAAASTLRLFQEPETSLSAPFCISLFLLEFHR
ncbi:hypothetical protein COCCADRAFT_82180 [Bipolaris zeicola 26-R-13]|uniref:Uncharacterized protein n=1 Tax=Cochliobolus carbonum (strain 26-R-13) TaxID=930089 RepID=W6YMQ6_COCC2|nr:uncharacterized protein COCCADRAFT_82180 [Bipolaris zeicola 26-R-13]EUC38768.1 hypothetical protein COCCADRAFT_82180 [Bipolaris zeicola 26-R-13]